MLSLFARVALFGTAYAPFFILLLIKNEIFQLWLTGLVAIGILLLALAVTGILISSLKSISPSLEKVQIIEGRSTETLSYLMTYMIPFIIEIEGLRGYIFIILLLLVILTFYISTDLIRHNLMFTILGYQIYKGRIGTTSVYLIYKGPAISGDTYLRCRKIHGKDIWFAEPREAEAP